MRQLAFPAETIDNATLAASELATNGWQHATLGGRYEPVTVPELWAWARTHPRPELVISVFDHCRNAFPHHAPGELMAESGRGLGIVQAITTAWGSNLSRSRLTPQPNPGKATWCTLPLPPGWPTPPRPIHPAVAAQRLLLLLAARGLPGTRRSDTTGVSVITTCGLDIWVKPRWFTWKAAATGYLRFPLLDLQPAAEHLITMIEERNSPERYAAISQPTSRGSLSGCPTPSDDERPR